MSIITKSLYSGYSGRYFIVYFVETFMVWTKNKNKYFTILLWNVTNGIQNRLSGVSI